ncbi:acyltransferase [Sunxiuqinia elliptica]|uniref:Chloramphenicol acetyltransferase n=1 Tax=Sunxiuqinia elliptica TaxID=655355 RepID=A0A4V3BXC8_9BACT|nr:acyltransferase [Sunxiuqinia elliptica]TDN98218.1 galactoside O-acetyltransferase [Sunxiuqinia elliptica]TDO60325.1 galactoside O-acetyltransferase [Sunxiuqinia elliptica]
MQSNSFYSPEELATLGFRSLGNNVLISRFARIYSSENISIGSNVRIDDFCILSGKIEIGNHVHISAYNALYGSSGIIINDYSGISPRCTLFSATDDFSGDFLIGPMVNPEFTNVISGQVRIEKFCQIGSSCVILPNVRINEGTVVGAMSLVNKDLEPWKIYKGIPAKISKNRSKKLLKIQKNG